MLGLSVDGALEDDVGIDTVGVMVGGSVGVTVGAGVGVGVGAGFGVVVSVVIGAGVVGLAVVRTTVVVPCTSSTHVHAHLNMTKHVPRWAV